MKRGLLFFLSLFLINFVSAQFFGGYGSFSITGFFSSPDAALLALFFIIAAFVAFILRRTNIFNNRGIIAVISFSVSLLSVYGIYNSGFNLEGLYSFSWIILIAGTIFIIWIFGKRKEGFSLSGGFAGLFFILGLFLILIATGIIFPDLIYEKTLVFVIGIVFLIIGIFLQKRAREWWKRNVESI